MADMFRNYSMGKLITQVYNYLKDEWEIKYFPNLDRLIHDLWHYHHFSTADLAKALWFLEANKTITLIGCKDGVKRIIPSLVKSENEKERHNLF